MRRFVNTDPNPNLYHKPAPNPNPGPGHDPDLRPGPRQADKARLSELKRVETERGADSPGVKLGIFPASTGPSSAVP